MRSVALPVGGVREKALAALRAGITTVILPRQNMQDLHGIPRELKRRITFVPVDHMREVLETALEKPAAEQRRPARRRPRRTAASAAASAKPRQR